MDSFELSRICKEMLSLPAKKFIRMDEHGNEKGKNRSTAEWMIAGLISKAREGNAASFVQILEVLDKVADGEYTEITFGSRDE